MSLTRSSDSCLPNKVWEINFRSFLLQRHEAHYSGCWKFCNSLDQTSNAKLAFRISFRIIFALANQSSTNTWKVVTDIINLITLLCDLNLPTSLTLYFSNDSTDFSILRRLDSRATNESTINEFFMFFSSTFFLSNRRNSNENIKRLFTFKWIKRNEKSSNPERAELKNIF